MRGCAVIPSAERQKTGAPLAGLFGFRPLPWALLAAIGVIVALYIVTAEAAKRLFYRKAAV